MNVLVLAAAVALLPALAWLAFFYTRDRYEREPRWLVARVFLWGLAAGPWASGMNLLIAQLFSHAVDGARRAGDLGGAAALLFGMVALSALNEETMKYTVVSSRLRREKNFNEPVDGIIYMTTAALGFAAGENFVYIVNTYFGVLAEAGQSGQETAVAVHNAFVNAFLVTAPLRSLLTMLGHVSWSGIVGHFLSGHALQDAPGRTLVAGVILAGAVHTAFNFPLFLQELGLPIAWVSALVWIFGLERYLTYFGQALHASPFRQEQLGGRRGDRLARRDVIADFQRRRTRQFVILPALVLAGVAIVGGSALLGTLDPPAYSLGFFFVLGAVAFNRFNWRCPNCGSYVGSGGLDPRTCSHCGATLHA